MSSARFFLTRWPSSTFGPGLHNHEIHAEQSACARGWSAARASICLQSLYRDLPPKDVGYKFQSFLHYNGNTYLMGAGLPPLCFLNEIEAKYKDITVMATRINNYRFVETRVIFGQCAEELVPGSQNRGLATQFAWAFRWHFKKCPRQRRQPSNRALDEVD
ncbi:hypothetical protein OPT61_g4693 [Boeremia exigua]|uniref:Uncharacterized protein n=1 Tax=Boeremia exigua TaxID=749465 RepID=A0ACC2ID63_9PLEO|nr:hypothetical protein OPT61_g4693 [Boeremia exigua]